MKLFNLKNIQFNTIFSDIQSYLNKSLGRGILSPSSVFGQLITVLSGVTQNILLYIEDSLTEQNKYTAQRKKSLYGLAAQSGYKLSYGRAAGVWVRISHKANNDEKLDVIIPEHTQLLCTQNGMYYCLNLNQPAMTIKTSGGIENNYFYAVQGRFEQQLFLATGGSLYVQNLSYVGYIDTQYLTVDVNGERWVQKESLYDMTPNEKAFYIEYNPTGGLDLIFGNTKHGKPIDVNDQIEVNYLLHDGESGNLSINGNTYFVFTKPLKNVNGDEIEGNNIFDINFATEDSVATGSNAESIQQARAMIGFNSRSLVLADSKNYENFLNKFSFVGYNRTWSEPGSMVVNSLVMRNYKSAMSQGSSYFNLKDSDFILSDIQKESIMNTLKNSGSQLAGTTYNIIDMELAKYALFIYVRLKDSSYDHTTVTNNIKIVVGNFFGNINSDQYIPKSDIIQQIKDNISVIDGVTCYFLSEANENAINTGQYTEKEYIWNPSKGTYDKKENIIQVYAGENPNLGLDAHGNILVKSDEQFPVLMGGWRWLNDEGQEVNTDAITIIYE